MESKIWPSTEVQSVTQRPAPYPVDLGDGVSANISPVPFNLNLPQGYHDQQLEQVAFKHPFARILLDRRIGYLGSIRPVRYSLLVYRRNHRTTLAEALGAALDEREAWTVNALIPLKDLGLGLAKILEEIASLPIQGMNPQRRSLSGTTENFL